MHYILYNCLVGLVFLSVFPVFLAYSGFTGKLRKGLRERLGFPDRAYHNTEDQFRIWLHASSVGEVQVAWALTAELRRTFPGVALLVSTVTEQGRMMARSRLLPDIPCLYAPFDLPCLVRRACKKIDPSLYVCIETELWPNMLRQIKRYGAKAVLLNGRMTERSFRRYRLVKPLMAAVLANFSAISAISAVDAERFIGLGADPRRVFVHGNAKYDLTFERQIEGAQNRFRAALGLTETDRVLVAGSTHSGEDEILLEVHKRLRAKMPGAILVLAPRHLERVPDIEVLLRRHAIEYDRLTEVHKDRRRARVVLVDTMGELAGLYSIATYAFCGGSLVPKGGHNVMEAAAWGIPVFFGPSMKDFADAKELLEAGQAGWTVRNAQELADRILLLNADAKQYNDAAQRARDIAMSQHGAARRQIQLVQDILLAENEGLL